MDLDALSSSKRLETTAAADARQRYLGIWVRERNGGLIRIALEAIVDFMSLPWQEAKSTGWAQEISLPHTESYFSFVN